MRILSITSLPDGGEGHMEVGKNIFYTVEGLAGTAAQFAWHVSDLMNKDRAYRRRTRVAIASQQVA